MSLLALQDIVESLIQTMLNNDTISPRKPFADSSGNAIPSAMVNINRPTEYLIQESQQLSMRNH
jgi:hypothetical protein